MIINDLIGVGQDLQQDLQKSQTPDEQAHLLEGLFKEVGSAVLHSVNETLKGNGIAVPALSKMEKDLENEGFDDFMSAGLSDQTINDLYKSVHDFKQ